MSHCACVYCVLPKLRQRVYILNETV
jgi:hypothetical protein